MLPSRDALPLIVTGVGFIVLLGGLFAFFPGTGSGAYLDLEPADTPESAPVTSEADLRADQHRLIAQATSPSGSDITVAYGYNPTRGVEEFVRLNGTYYRVTANQTNDTARVEKPVLIVTPAPNASDTVPLTDYGHHAAELIAPSSGSNESRTIVLQPDMQGRDDLLPTPRYGNITWKNQTYSIHAENRTVEQLIYTMSASVVATNESAFTEYLVDHELRVELVPEDLTQAERDIIEQATEGQYYEESPYSDTYERLQVMMFGEPTNRQYEVLVRYDGQLYRAKLQPIGWG